MKKAQRVIYYSDMENEEFSFAEITPKKIDGKYRYIRDGFFGKITQFLLYRIVATPIAVLYMKLKFGHKTVGKEVLKKYRKSGYFIFGNHTQEIADAIIPTLVSSMKKTFVIVHANNVSMPVLGRLTPYMGALPLPADREATANFVKAVEKRCEKDVVCIYPEAHIWPYYTKIRPFSDKSFRYPLKYDKPVFCFTNTYQAKKKGDKWGKVRIVTYVDGPFFVDKNLPLAEQKKTLRDSVYQAMTKRAENSNVEVIKYIEKEKSND